MWTQEDDKALLNLINGDLSLPVRQLLNRARETMARLDAEKREALDVAQKALDLADRNHADAIQIAKDYQQHLGQPISSGYLSFIGRM